MTDINFTNTSLTQTVRTITWNLAENQTGAWAAVSDYSDKTVHIFGTIDGAVVTLQGSNDPLVLTSPDTADAETLTDPLNNPISGSSKALTQILENPLYIRPIVTGGDGSTAVSIVMAVRN
jgi:hypothetical protein